VVAPHGSPRSGAEDIDVEERIPPVVDPRDAGPTELGADIASSRSAAVLRAVRITTEQLFGAASWEDEIGALLERVGLAEELSRVSVIQRASATDGSLTIARIYQWNAPGTPPIGEELIGSDLAPTDGVTTEILEAFLRDECIEGTTSSLPEPHRSLVEAYGSRAFALAPVHVEGALWGMMMFDDCLIERSWSRSELDALRAAAGLLGAAIGREIAQREYRTLVERVPGVVYSAIDGEDRTWLFVSRRSEAMLGYPVETWLAEPTLWRARMHPEDRPRVVGAERTTRASGGRSSTEYRWMRGDGTWIWIRDVADHEEGEDGGPGLLHGIMLDVTDEKEAETRLSESREQLRTIVDAEPECVKILDLNGRLIEMNPAGLAMIEADHLDQVLATDVSTLVVEEDRAAFRDTIREASSGGSRIVEFEIEGLKGTHRWLEARMVPLRGVTQQIEAVLGITRDVTQRHRTEAELRGSVSMLRDLSEERRALLERLDRAQEDERARISEDIHDDSIQAMTALGFRIERLSRMVTEPEALDVIDRLKDQVSEAVGRLRRLMSELRPPILDDGLAPALRAAAAQFGEQTGIDYVVESTMDREPSDPIRSTAYRIAQEALGNVRKHSGAHRVDVGLSRTEEGFTVRITDDGRGFHVDGRDRSPHGHLGLTAMRDRAERAGGSWRIESTPGVGTTVEFVLPEEPSG
jgi:PAS domain S-box-containing protein